MRSVTVVALVGILLSSSTILIGEDNPIVQLAGLRVVGPGHGLNGTELRAFRQQSGTTLALLVQMPESRKIVDVDDSKCSLVEFRDDLGHDMLDGVDWSGFPEISSDRRLALIEVTSRSRPSPDASRVFAKGTLHVDVASSENTEKIERLDLEIGTKVNVRQEGIQVMKVEAENGGLTLVLQISQAFKSSLKDVRFYTSDGNLVSFWGQGSFSFGRAAQMEYNLDTESIPEFLRVEIDLWQERESLKLPFGMESGVGF